MSKWQWILKQFGRRLWVRALLFCVLAIATALVALWLKDFIPEDVSRKVGAEAVDNILQIIASSMLAVTTFSLSTMVAAYSAATSNVTPRSTQLLLQDSTAQTALSVFIGAFLYSLVGIIALSMHIYGDSGRLVLFVVTIFVIILIVGVLLRWIHYLSHLGRVDETINMVERATARALKQRTETAFLGGTQLKKYKPAARHVPVANRRVGYLQYIDMRSLSRIAERLEATFYLCVTPGSFCDGVGPLFYSSEALDDDDVAQACEAFSIADGRSFDQDPRFGLVVLSEIACRALSPAVNDPGTAIDIVGTSLRLLAPWASHGEKTHEPSYPSIHVPALSTADLFEDIYAPIIRDGVNNLQVAIRLQKAFASLAQMGHADMTREAVKLSEYALAYVKQSTLLDSDKRVIASLAQSVGKDSSC